MEHLGENTVTELLAALVTANRRERIDAHTATCAACRRLISELVRRSATSPRLALGSPGAGSERVPLEGTTIDRYTLGARIGSGASGTVIEAHDPELDRTVALKLLHPEHAQRERIQREARALAKLAHPNVVAVYDAGTYEGELFVAMERVDGSDLRTWLRTQRSVAEILDAFAQLGRGLAAAHAAGIVHRDVKPDNILVGNDRRVRIADFGLAGGPDGSIDFIGTPAYMAPEQFEDGGASTASDQFAFCVALYEALYGKRPFAINLTEEVARGLPTDTRVGVPRAVRSALARGLSVDPTHRFPSMTALVDALQPRRRKQLIAAGVIGALAIGGAGFAIARVASDKPAVCADAASEADAVWNPARGAALHARFAATKVPFANTAWTSVEREVTKYVTDWRDMRVEACTATRIRGAQSDHVLALRMQCLDRVLVELDATLGVLASATPTELAAASAAIEALPSLATCANTTALLAPVPPPAGAETASAADVSRDIARASALADAARWQDAVAAATKIATRARSLAHAPTRAAALYLLGRAQSGGGDPKAAEASLRDAFAAAEMGHDDLLAARAAVELIWVIGQTQARYDDGREWAFLAETFLKRAGGAPDLEARLEGNRGHLDFATSRYDAARAHYERALELRERLDGRDSRGVAGALGNLARAIAAQGDTARALELTKRAVAATERALGPTHPDVAIAANMLGSVENNRGDFEAALAAFDRAIAIAEPVLGKDHPLVGQYLINRGYALQALGRNELALEALDRAISIFDRDGASRDMLAAALSGKGDVYRALERPRDALPSYKRALTLAIELDPANDVTASAIESVAAAQLELGRATEALAGYRRSLAIRERLAGFDYFENAYAHAGIGDAELALGHAGEAVAAYREAVRLFDSYEGDGATRGMTRFALAKALDRSRGDAREIKTLLQTAERELVASGPRVARDLAELRAWHPRAR